MELLLSVAAFIIANFIFFYPLGSRTGSMQELLLVVLGVLILVQAFFWYRRRTPEAQPVPVAPQKKEPEKAPPAPSLDAAVEAGVVQFLARMQEKGRLVDFLMDDIAPYSNEQIGVVSRVVHQGCREVLKGAFDIVPVHGGQERDQVSLAAEFDAASYRLMGKVPEHPPYQGTVLHRGWKATRVSLPRVSESARDAAAARKVIAPAEVEIG